MRPSVAASNQGIFHEASIFGSDAELRDTALPFLSAGLDANEPTYVILAPHNNDLVRAELGERDGLHYVPAPDAYVNPTATVRQYREIAEAAVAAGAPQIRFVTEVPHPGSGSIWDWWGRYEAAVNDIFSDLPVWAICTYDERTTPVAVLDEVVRAHPYLAGPDGEHVHNPHYQPPSSFLEQRAAGYLDPLEAGSPTLQLVDPTITQARRSAARLAGPVLGVARADDLALAVAEMTANALSYGKPPVELRLWVGPDRVVATVWDRGNGVRDAAAGLAPVSADRQSGRGLWIATQVCDHLGLTKSADGFLVRLVKGNPSVGT